MRNEWNNGQGTAAVCPHCGAQILADPDKDAAICPCCGSAFAVAGAIRAYNGQYPARQPDVPPSLYPPMGPGAAVYENPGRRKKRHTFWWILGWLIIFPVPLTILMLRNRKLNAGLRIVIILAGWTAFAMIGLRGGAERMTQPSASAPAQVTERSRPESVARPTDLPVTAVPAAPAEEPEEPAEEPAEATPEAAPDSGVTPEFKTAMDSYEAFFDEYVEFMESLSESPDDITLLMQYAGFMSRFASTMEALDAIDETALSPADDAYYIEVMARIDMKLLQAAQTAG